MTIKNRETDAVSEKIAVLVVDDSAVVRGIVTRELSSHPDIEVVASASHGEMAVVEIQRRPVDVVILDLEMPVMDGMTALPLLLAARPGVKVLIASSLSRRNAEISLRALQLGATDYLAKPEAGETLVTADEFKRDLVAKVRALGVRQRRASPLPVTAPLRPLAQPSGRDLRRPAVIGIGGSTGAPNALVALFAGIRGKVRPPIMLTQHMPPTFTALLAEQLQRAGDRPCAEARDGEPVLEGRAYVAPGGYHLSVEPTDGHPVCRLSQSAPENYCRPAVDPMFRSLAATYGPHAMGVILTGMGSDGALGCKAISDGGGRFIVQDEATSVVWGMPGAATRAGPAEAVLPLDEMAPYLIRATA